MPKVLLKVMPLPSSAASTKPIVPIASLPSFPTGDACS
jgi:hypothetical protein